MRQKGTQPTAPPRPVFGVAILAAGTSSRLGSPKQLVPYRGRPLLRHLARQALACRQVPVIVVVGGNADEVTPALEGLGLRVIHNPGWSEGAAASVRLCVQLAGRQKPAWEGLLLMSCDQPAVTSRHLEGMLETARSHPGRIVASEYADTLGVPAFFPSRFFPELSRLAGDVGAKQVIFRHLDLTVPVPLPDGEVDVDVVEDLAGLEGLRRVSPRRTQRTRSPGKKIREGGAAMKVALVQSRAGLDVEENLRRGVEAVEEAAGSGAQVIVFPELAFLPFFPQKPDWPGALDWAETVPGPTTERFSRLASRHGVVIVLNLYEIADGKTYDCSPVIDADGRLLGVTRMIHIIEAPCFHEQRYYAPGDRGAPVYETAHGRIGVAICYDRHYPEYMRALGLKGAQLVAVPQAGSVGEWPEGLFEAEMRVAGFQNGYFTALANRVGAEQCLTFAGESFVTDPAGRVLAQAPQGRECILYADLDLAQTAQSHANRHFLKDRRPGVTF